MRCTRLPLAPFLILLGLLAGLGLVAVLAAPRIESVTPASGASGVSARAPIVVAFNQPMSAESVQSRFATVPPADGVFEWRGNSFTFTPRGGWPSGSAITARLASGARSRRGLPLLTANEWAFTVGNPRVAFLLQTDGIPNVWAAPLAGGDPAQITAEEAGVYDFDPSPNGTQIVYSALRPEGGADLRLAHSDGSGARDLLPCAGEACVAPVWSPDGARLAFERRPLITGLSGATMFGDPAVWVLDVATGEAAAIADNPGDATGAPRWSPDGTRLAFFDSTLQAIVVHGFDGSVTYVPDTSGEMGTWSPDGNAIVFPEILTLTVTAEPEATAAPGLAPVEDRERLYSHLMQVTIATNAMRDLSGEPLVEDLSAAYSPSGETIAFARKYVDTRWTPGRQLWLMRADGSGARPLTDEPNANHSAIQWTPDGSTLIFMRFTITDPAAPAEIWAMGSDGTNARRLVVGGYLPAYLP